MRFRSEADAAAVRKGFQKFVYMFVKTLGLPLRIIRRVRRYRGDGIVVWVCYCL